MTQNEARPLRLLLVEDNPGDARLLVEELKEVPSVRFEVRHVTRLAEAMSRSSVEVVRIATGILRSRSSALIAARTSRPPIRGRLRSRRIRSGRGAASYRPSRRRKASASTPSGATCRLLCTFPSLSASRVSRTSPGLSSTRRTSTGREMACVLISRRAPGREW